MNILHSFLPRLLFALLLAAISISPSAALSAEPVEAPAGAELKVDWVKGPAKVDVGSSVAQLDLSSEFAFAKAKDTQALLQSWGNETDGSEVGLVMPKAEDQDWVVVFTWDPVGYVKDDDKDKIDAAALLKSLQEGTEEGNAFRKEHGLPALHVLGWLEPPRYDTKSHNLVWATRARNDAGKESTNYNVRVLGREGYLSVTLVDSPDKLAASKPAVEKVLASLSFKSGKSYAEWLPGDKVAKYGLAALVAGGAGVAAAKLGLFAGLGKLIAKGGKLIVVAVAAIGAFFAKIWRKLRGRSVSPKPPPGTH
jgi:uncharacterized membrane-anchored protein